MCARQIQNSPWIRGGKCPLDRRQLVRGQPHRRPGGSRAIPSRLAPGQQHAYFVTLAADEQPGDRRRQRIEITAPGRFVRKAMWPIYGDAIERRLGAALSEKEARTLTELLRKVRA